MSGFDISVVAIHWLANTVASKDLCAHGGVRVSLGDELLLDAEDLAVSAGALHLLRTLHTSHTPDRPIAEHLVPHCGHFMAIDETDGHVENIGCNTGANWWVLAEGDMVALTFNTGRVVSIPTIVWCRAVIAFSDQVDAFYRASATKDPDDEYDRHWYDLFRAEWARLRASAPCAA